MMVVAVSQQQSPISLVNDPLYVGVDVGNDSHVAAFCSRYLQRKHKTFTKYPTMNVANSRLEFEHLVAKMRIYAPLDQCIVIMEKTGHYHLPLLQYLQERGVTVYLLHVQKKPRGQKNDRIDAQRLANTGFAQLELGAQPESPDKELHQVRPATEISIILREATQYYRDLARQIVRDKNQLTAIGDQLFPELSLIFKDINGPSALVFRERFPTPHDMFLASLDELIETRPYNYPSRDALIKLQELAAHSIGLRDQGHVRSLVLQQSLLIKQLRVLLDNEEAVKREITDIVKESREGQILLSLGNFVGCLAAGEIIACIGDIHNFETPGKFKGYTGWIPVEDQSGKSFFGVALSRGGNRILRDAMFLIAMRAVNKKYDGTAWRDLYERLVERQCPYDAKKKRRTGRLRPLSRVAGQIAGMIYQFLKKDAEVVAATPGARPALYNKDVHMAHMKRRR